MVAIPISKGPYSFNEMLSLMSEEDKCVFSVSEMEVLERDLDVAIEKEGKWLGKAKLAFSWERRSLWTVPMPLYQLTSGKMSFSSIMGISVTVVCGDGILLKRKPDTDLDCPGSLAPMCAYIVVPVSNWESKDYCPTLLGWDDVVDYNIIEVIKREGGIKDLSIDQVIIGEMGLVEVDYPRHQTELVMTVTLQDSMLYRALAENGWELYNPEGIAEIIGSADRKNASAHLAAMGLAVGTEFFGATIHMINSMEV